MRPVRRFRYRLKIAALQNLILFGVLAVGFAVPSVWV